MKNSGSKTREEAKDCTGRTSWLRCLLLAGFVTFGAAIWCQRGSAQVNAKRQILSGPVTFSQHIAPILFQHCAPCHRPGQAAPFSLLTYDDAKKRARQIAEVTQVRYMPPWLPESRENEFIGQRTLTEEQIALIRRWVNENSPEGASVHMPPTPQWQEGWHLGEPDLIVTLPQPYTLAVDGPDVYRNFVTSLPITSKRYVQAYELRPGNRKVVHHAFLRIDRTGECRRRDEMDAEPGFAGLHTPAGAQAPDGQFLSWQPGKVPMRGTEVNIWTLEPRSDLVFQLHLQPSGKPESVQPSVGFYFTDHPPRIVPFKIGLSSFTIDIPAGRSDYRVSESYRLPVDVRLHAILPHAHYLATELRGIATLPDGTITQLFHIPRWDFNWQGEYNYTQPLSLPKGTTVTMDYRFDNSTNNVRAPNHPPRRVRYGTQSTDEMAELWLQVRPHNTNDLAVLTRDYQPYIFKDSIAYNRYLLESNPEDSRAHNEIGKASLFLGREADAASHFQRALELAPDFDEPHYFHGLMLRMKGKLVAAADEFETALRLNPHNHKARGNLGLVRLQQGDMDLAEAHLKEALRLNPDDTIARATLELIKQAKLQRP